MPQIKGVCVPPICFSLLHNIVGAKMVVLVQQTNGTYAVDKNLTAKLPGALGQPLIAKFNAHRAKFRPLVTQKCDGCGCAPIGAVQGFPVTIPDAEIDNFAFPAPDGLAHVMVTGITGQMRLGCASPRVRGCSRSSQMRSAGRYSRIPSHHTLNVRTPPNR